MYQVTKRDGKIANFDIIKISNAIKKATGRNYVLESYVQHATEEKSTSKAASYVSIMENGKTHWGVGIHRDIMTSSVGALVSAVNRLLTE